MNLQQDHVRRILENNKRLATFVIEDLRRSLSSLDFSKEFIDDLLVDLGMFDVRGFGEKWSVELYNKYSVGFFRNHVPTYFSKYVVPVTPSSSKVIDVGCGTGILAKLFAEEKRFECILGIDIDSYPEWRLFQSEVVRFEVVKEDQFIQFLKDEAPDSIVLTWTLHHMIYDEQERYIKYVYENLKKGTKIVILEDAYSTNIPAENGEDLYRRFMDWTPEERRDIMSVYDWVANRVLAQRAHVPIPCAYRTLEDWSSLLEKNNFKVEIQKFIGFPDSRDINTPQSLIVARRT